MTWDLGQVTGDTCQVTKDFLFPFFWVLMVLMLITADAKRFDVSCMQDLFLLVGLMCWWCCGGGGLGYYGEDIGRHSNAIAYP